MQLKWKEVKKLLEKVQVTFREGKDPGGWLVNEGKKILYLRMSKGEGDVPGHVPDKIRQSLHLNEELFMQLKNCPLSREEYIEILKKKGCL
jgi:hypothetical protein